MKEGSLSLVREFVNTDDDDSLRKWLGDHRGQALGVRLRRAAELREAVLELIASRKKVSRSAVSQLNTAGKRADLRLTFGNDGTVRLMPHASQMDRLLGEILVAIADAQADGRWEHLRLCANDGCREAFFDVSRSGGRKWCSMAGCGNRNKAAAWRARQRR
jgi:predicted RNA-binding Zn ribbon-like protein